RVRHGRGRKNQTVDHQTVVRADVDLAIGYGRHGELDNGAEVVAAAGLLAAVPQFRGEGGGVVGVNLIEIPVHDPGDAAGRAIGTHGHRAGQVAEVVDGGLRSRAQRAVGIYDVGVGPTAIAANPIDLAVEESGGAERTAQLHRRRVVAAAVGYGIENMI